MSLPNIENTITLSIVVPVFNEGEPLIHTMDVVRQNVTSLGVPFEIIVIDDGSTDNTWTILETIANQVPNVKPIALSRNFGKESALCAGLEAAGGDAVILMDADLQHPPTLIPQMFETWQKEHVNIVEAVKVARGKETIINRGGAHLFYFLLNKLTGYQLTGASDFKLIDRQVVSAWLKMGEHNLFFRGMIAWLGFRKIQLPFVVPDRLEGKSKWSLFKLFRLTLTAVTSFSALPLHFVTILGGWFLLFAIILGAQTLFNKVTGRAVDGFATVILLNLVIGSVLMISLGTIGEYIARIYDEVKDRPRYIIRKQLNFKN